MSPFYWGVIFGLFVGVNLAVVVVGLLAGAKCGECGAWLQQKLNGSSERPTC